MQDLTPVVSQNKNVLDIKLNIEKSVFKATRVFENTTGVN
jgi:hypothetical protein